MRPIQQLEQIANQWRSSKNNETAQDAVITAAREFLKRNLSDYEKDEVNDFYDFRANDSVGLLCFVDRHGKRRWQAFFDDTQDGIQCNLKQALRAEEWWQPEFDDIDFSQKVE